MDRPEVAVFLNSAMEPVVISFQTGMVDLRCVAKLCHGGILQ
jgi:hypothetical protein